VFFFLAYAFVCLLFIVVVCLFVVLSSFSKQQTLKELKYFLKNSVASVRKQTIPSERPPLVSEVSANFLRI
jgi:hypothetical protein